MKRFLKNFTLMMAAIVGVVSCSEADIEDIIVVPEVAETILYAATAVAPETKVEFTDNDSEGIALAWEVDDEFTVYEGDTAVGVFTCMDVESGKFRSDAALTVGGSYTAKYGSAENIWEQNGDEINNLDAACVMSAEFTYGNDDAITFEHEMAIITFKFESDSKPAKLIFENGAEVYTILYSEIEPADGVYTSHIMVNPCDAEERDLAFSLYDSEGTAYDIRTVTSSVAYVAGYRYTATVSDLELCTWSGEGSGTESDPYLVSTAEQLRELSTNVNSGMSYDDRYLLMTCDIDLGGIDADGNGIAENEFTAIGYYTSSSDYSYFKGTFDGGGYEISGLYINQPETSYQGLFGRVSGATIKNLGVSGSVTGYSYVGGIVGSIGSTNSPITACYNTGKISGTGYYVGGVVGYAWSSSSPVTECYNTGEVSGSGNSVGGVVGYASASPITACYNTGEVSGTSYIGGVVGYAASSPTTACYNTGEVSGSESVGGVVGFASASTVTECYNAGEVSGSESVGGVVGSASYYSTVTECYNTGEVLGSESVGGVVGYASDSTVTECYNTGEVLGSESVGGVVGYASDSTATACYNTGEVSGSGNYVGGVVGYASYSTTTACYNTGEVSGSSGYIGGIVGYAKSYSIVTACYNTGVVSGSGDYVGGVAGSVSSSAITACYYYPLSTLVSTYGTKVLSASELNNVVATMNKAAGEDYFTVNSDNILPSLLGEQIAYEWGEIQESMITISNLEEFKEFRDLVNSGSSPFSATLTADIDLGGESWTPIGTSSNPCSTIFDGGGYTISGLYINSPDSYQGLFGYIYDGVIKNLTVKEPNIIGSGNVGAICGRIREGDISDCAVEGGSVSGASTYVGGVVGYVYTNSSVITCHNTSEVSGASSHVGGVIGSVSCSTVTECYNAGEVSGSSYNTGGIVGYLYTSAITSCYNTGKVSGSTRPGGVIGFASTYSTVTECYNTGEVSGSERVGGVAGGTYFNSTVTECYNTGGVSGTSDYVGGVVGISTYYVTECYNTGGVSGTNDYVGGVVGHSTSSTTTCYNTGGVSGTNDYVGGVVGYSTSSTTACYNTGGVSGTNDYVGGVVGYSTSKVTACYNTGGVSGTSNYLGGVIGSNYSNSSFTMTACYYLSTTLDSDWGIRVTSVSKLNDVVADMNSAAGAEYFTVNSDDILPSLLGEQITYDGESSDEEEDIVIITIGDVYDDGTDKGIVWWVSDNMKYCKILAIEEGGDSKVVFTTVSSLWVDDCSDYSDGAANTAAMRQYAIDTYGEDNYYTYFPILEWIDEKGDDWYLPAYNEYTTLLPLYYSNSDYKAALALYDDAIRSEFYWSSTITKAGYAYAIKYSSASSSSKSTYGTVNSSGRYARRVKLITLN